ncbi:DNA topoisomerase I, partial [bacterium (Candidatus Torokbacteria) CG09_land_8_20_14_0_10_42_11]
DLVDAQQARRVLDRLVGYKLSPFLWRKVSRGLSAGRVQSVAVRLICEREKEIQKFKPEEYWSMEALLCGNQEAKEFKASLIKRDGKSIPKLGIKSKEEAEKIQNDLKNAAYKIIKIEKKETAKYAKPAFTTATLQQEAAGRLGFSAKNTMRLAQQLYEGVKLGKNKAQGLITYMRTDSTNMAQKALAEIR